MAETETTESCDHTCDGRHDGAGDDAHRRVGAARPLVALVHAYQRAREGHPSPCRFVPSCSTYAAEALEAHGALRGSWLSVRRLSRCHPWGGSGYDPVPPSRQSDRSTWNTEEPSPGSLPDRKVP